MIMGVVLFTIIIIIIIWIRQFVFLMSLEDSMFPGKYDKILWYVVFIVSPIITPFAFMLWKKIKLNETIEKRKSNVPLKT